MPSHSQHSLDDLIARANRASNRTAQLQGRHTQLSAELSALELETGELTRSVLLLDKVLELFRALFDHLVAQQVKSVDSLVTQGLRSVLFDQDISFESELDLKRGKVWVDFFLQKEGHKGHPVESFGGGPTSLASLMLRLAVLLKLKRYPLLILDETLGAVSNEYTEQTALFLRKLSEETGVDILMITHKQAFVDYSDRAYKGVEIVKADKTQLELRQV